MMCNTELLNSFMGIRTAASNTFAVSCRCCVLHRADGEKPAAVTTIRQVIRDRNAALTALTPGTARRKLASAQQQGVESGGSGGAGSGAAQQISVTSYSRHHEASTTTRVVSPDSEAGLFTRSAQLRTSNRKRRASECGRSIETAAAAALGASEDYFATEEVNC